PRAVPSPEEEIASDEVSSLFVVWGPGAPPRLALQALRRESEAQVSGNRAGIDRIGRAAVARAARRGHRLSVFGARAGGNPGLLRSVDDPHLDVGFDADLAG